jgi:hypothetical protein
MIEIFFVGELQTIDDLQGLNKADHMFVICQAQDRGTVRRAGLLLWCIWQNLNDTLWINVQQNSRQLGKWSYESWKD